jgi:glycosyltransferase involved in cell wall biosynthesis
MELNKKKILYVGGFMLPDKNAAAQRVIANGKLFKKVGYDVYFIDVQNNISNKNDFKKEYFDKFQYLVKSKKYPKSKTEWFSHISSIKFIKDAIENDLSSKPDIIIVYNYPALSLFKLTKYCKKNNIKIIADVTEWYAPEGNFLFKVVKGLDSYFRMNHLHKSLDGLIVISRYLENYYKEKNSIRLPPLIDKNSNKWESINYPETKTINLVYVGSISSGKKDRLDFIINSLDRIKNRTGKFIFTIIGVTKLQYIKNFGKEFLPENIDNFVSFLGRKPHEEVVSFIKKADYSIFLRDKNLTNTAGFPTKFVESLACGTPVITNVSSDLLEYLSSGYLGSCLSTLDNEELDKSLIIALQRDKNELLEMKKHCFNFFDFHYEIYEKQFIRFLKKI